MKTRKTKGQSAGWFTETAPLKPGDILHLKCNGPINIEGDDRSDALFNGVGDLHWSREGQVVKVHFDGPISAAVPRDAHLRLDTDGPVKVRKVTEGEIEALSMDGPLTVEGGASLHVRNADGPLIVSRISGPVMVTNIDGPTTLKEIGGDVTVSNADGPVVIKRCDGDIDIATDGGAYLTLAGDVAQNVRLRVDGNAFLKVPASTRVAGRIQADGRISVELDGQSIQAENETITLPRPEGAQPVITVDLEADGDVYIGPNPPAAEANSGIHFMGLAGLFGRRRGKKQVKVTRTVATPPPADSAPPKDNLAAEREMILRMVAEGKITAEEGDQLLEALQ